MRKKLLKHLILALLLTVAVPNVKSQIAHVGDILCTTGVYVSPSDYAASGLEAMGVIFYVDATGQHGWAVALEDAGIYEWMHVTWDTPLSNYTSIRAAIYDLNGLFNTQEVLEFSVSAGRAVPALEALDVTNGWYLPSIGQLNYLYGNLVEINESLTTVGGMTFNMAEGWTYWSSTEKGNGNVWCLNSSGNIFYDIQNRNYHARGIHNF